MLLSFTGLILMALIVGHTIYRLIINHGASDCSFTLSDKELIQVQQALILVGIISIILILIYRG